MEPSYVLFWLEFLTGRFFFIIAGLIGMAVYIGALYLANRNIKVKLSQDVLPRVYRSPMATAIFFGLRFLGISFYLGMLVLAGASVSVTYSNL